METLKALGLRSGWIYEVLMETTGLQRGGLQQEGLHQGGLQRGGLHRAPMGIRTDDFKRFIVDVYKGSESYANLISYGVGSVYFIEEPAYLAMPDEADYFAKADFKVLESRGSEPKRFVCGVLRLDILREGKALNRANGLFIEYLIEKSRKSLSRESAKRCEHYKKTIRKVAPGSKYERLIAKWER